MTDKSAKSSTRNSKFINAPPEVVYNAFTDPAALAVWFAPGDMIAKVRNFDHRVGGGYVMSLFYPSSDSTSHGKSSEKEDRYTARFVELVPPKKLVEAITFDTDDPAFAGEMIMKVTLDAQNDGTTVTILFENIPSGIRPENNETGTELSLEKLSRYIEDQK